MTKRSAFEALYEACYERVFFFVRKRTADEEVAKDLAQQTFLRLWEKAPNQGEVTEAYVFTIVRNLLHDHYRERLRRLDTGPITPEMMATTPDEASAEDELLIAVRREIARLPSRRRQIFRLSKENGLAYREIAEELDISQKTVEHQMGAALRTLRSKLAHLLFLFL